MVSLIFRAKVKPGKEDDAVKKWAKMVEAVEANEPGAIVYALHRLQDDPSELIFWEVYADDDAFKAHMGTPHMAEMRAAFADYFDPTTVKMERLERLAGFLRS